MVKSSDKTHVEEMDGKMNYGYLNNYLNIVIYKF